MILNLNKMLGPMLTAVVLLTGCQETLHTDFPVTADDQAAILSDDVHIIRLTPENISNYRNSKRAWHPKNTLNASAASWRYLVGVGDVLSVTVWDHPELTLPAGEQRSQVESGSPVNAAGEIFYPYIGNVRVEGRDTTAIQRELSERLSEFVPDPQIEVKVAAFNSQKVIITGAVARPGSVGISNIPLNLVEALTASGGMLSAADSRQVKIRRAGETHYIDLEAFLRSGNGVNNPILHGGDIVNIPVRTNNVAYILGKVQTPGSVDIGNDGLNLTEALTQRGGLDEDIANAQGIFVFRAGANNHGFDVFQLDASTPLAFVIATKFALHPQDVVYVVADPIAQWNAIIEGLLPSISAIRGIQLVAGLN